MTDERLLVVKAVHAGQLPTSAITEEDILYMQQSLMDRILEKKHQQNPGMVFWTEERPSIH